MTIAIPVATNVAWDQERSEAIQKALEERPMLTARDVMEAALASRDVDGLADVDISGNQAIFTGTEHVIGFCLSVVREKETELFIL